MLSTSGPVNFLAHLVASSSWMASGLVSVTLANSLSSPKLALLRTRCR